ncbi:MAG: type II toxin-antitoxin system RelE/ParE family toxin [Pseudomonadota bacterium]
MSCYVTNLRIFIDEGYIKLLEEFGHELSRPHADTLKGSNHANLKELRFKADNGVWRVAYAFDPERKAILLVAGDKAGVNEQRFYKTLITKADQRFEDHLKKLKARK